MSHHIIRTILVHPSYTDMIKPILNDYVNASAAESDCVSLNVYNHQLDSRMYILEGVWANEISYLYHIDQLHYKQFNYVTSALLISPADCPHLVPATL